MLKADSAKAWLRDLGFAYLLVDRRGAIDRGS
jgi:hypothetical protein